MSPWPARPKHQSESFTCTLKIIFGVDAGIVLFSDDAQGLEDAEPEASQEGLRWDEASYEEREQSLLRVL